MTEYIQNASPVQIPPIYVQNQKCQECTSLQEKSNKREYQAHSYTYSLLVSRHSGDEYRIKVLSFLNLIANGLSAPRGTILTICVFVRRRREDFPEVRESEYLSSLGQCSAMLKS